MRFVAIGPSACSSALAIAAVALATAASVGAQTGSLAGTVARDSSGHMIGGAEIRLPQVNRAVTTNYLGEFGIAGIALSTAAVQAVCLLVLAGAVFTDKRGFVG